MEQSDYNFGDRLLHHLALSAPFVGKLTFEIETTLSSRKQDDANTKHVFVSGLARAGTTALMRAFYATGYYRSLTYRDMPFVLMPGIWKKLSTLFHTHDEVKERAHGDGIHVDFDSPEAFEEVFWRTFSGDEYIFDDCLKPHRASEELIEQFRLYVGSIVGSSSGLHQRRYLSKNNNNILRLASVRQAFPNALILIPFRNPLQHAISLLSQHQIFSDRHVIDKFSLDYMNWLCHHEFGMNHIPFRFNQKIDLSLTDYAADNINYWLVTWINSYRYLLDAAPSGSVFVCYEELCSSPAETLDYLFAVADISLKKIHQHETFRASPVKEASGVDENIKIQAQQIYLELKSRCLR